MPWLWTSDAAVDQSVVDAEDVVLDDEDDELPSLPEPPELAASVFVLVELDEDSLGRLEEEPLRESLR